MKDQPGSKLKYSVVALWTPAKFDANGKQCWENLVQEIREAIQKIPAFRKIDGKGIRQINSNFLAKFDQAKMGIRDGVQREEYEGYGPGTLFATLGSELRPGVINMAGDKIGPEEGNADELYPGCWCRATVTPFAYSNAGRGYSLGLNNLQKIKDGPRLDSRVKPEDDFSDDLDGEWLDQNEEDDDDDGDSDDDESDFG